MGDAKRWWKTLTVDDLGFGILLEHHSRSKRTHHEVLSWLFVATRTRVLRHLLNRQRSRSPIAQHSVYVVSISIVVYLSIYLNCLLYPIYLLYLSIYRICLIYPSHPSYPSIGKTSSSTILQLDGQSYHSEFIECIKRMDLGWCLLSYLPGRALGELGSALLQVVRCGCAAWLLSSLFRSRFSNRLQPV